MRNCHLRSMRGPALLCTMILACIAAGCGGKTKTKVFGKVTVGTQTLDGGTLVFMPEDEGPGGGTAQIDQDGNYTLTLTKQGTMKVYVYPPTPSDPASTLRGGPPKDRAGPPKDVGAPPGAASGRTGVAKKSTVNIPKKYTDPKLTDLVVEIKSGEQELPIHFK